MSDIAIRVENLSKRYRIGQREPYKALRDVLPRHRSLPQFIWALKDISFDVKRGELVGIIGCNGAGKAILLKVLPHHRADGGLCRDIRTGEDGSPDDFRKQGEVIRW